MAFETASTADVDSVTEPERGGMWFFREALGTEGLGVTIREMEPGTSGRGHDHAEEGQEEVYVCVDGTVDVECGDETVTLEENEVVWLSPDQQRNIHNRSSEPARLVLFGAVTASD